MHELRQAVRALLRRPLFTSLTIGTLALGLGACAAVFGIVRGVLLQPLPFEDADRLVRIDAISSEGYGISLSVPNHMDWDRRSRVFSGFASAAGWSLTRSSDRGAEMVDARRVLGPFFDVLGIQALRGRVFSGEETLPGSESVVVLGHGFWQRAFGGDPSVIGRTIEMDGGPHMVIGVLPPGVGYPRPDVEAYLPLGPVAATLPWDIRDSSFGLEAVARLAPGITIDAAQADLARVAREIEAEEGIEPAHGELIGLADAFLGDARRALYLLLAAVGLVLLIVCANVANLFLARGEERALELGMRKALGAGTRAALRPVVYESLIIASLGGLLGIACAAAVTDALPALLPIDIPSLVIDRVGVDLPVALAILGIALTTGLLFGVPGAGVARAPVERLLRAGRGGTASREGERLRAVLVVTQVALSVVLLVGAGLMLRSLGALLAVDKGFVSEDVLTARLRIPQGTFEERAQWLAFHDQLARSLEARPDVQIASLALLTPLAGRSWEMGATPEGVPLSHESGTSMLYNIVTPDWFAALGIPIVRGRGFEPSDRDGTTPVAIVDERLASTFWPGEDPLGKRFTFETAEPGVHGPDAVPVYRTVVGVVPNVRHYTITEPSRIQAWVPMAQSGNVWGLGMSLAVKLRGAEAPVAEALRQEVATLRGDVALSDLRPLQGYVDDALAYSRALGSVLGAFAAAAMILAAIGIFGVLTLIVGRRTREIGIRMAIGAQPGEIRRMVAWQGLRLTLIGAVIGTAGAAFGTRILRAFLFGVQPLDPIVYLIVPPLLIVAALAAAWLPARRATRVEPATVLRAEA